MSDPRVICLGMNHESWLAIEHLIGVGANLAAIAGLDEKHSKGVSDFVDLSKLAEKYGIAWLPISDVNSAEAKASLSAQNADIMFVTGWSQLLHSDTINLFPKGVVGSHPTALPQGRGRAPIPWTILQSETSSALTLFQMEAGVDDGLILKQMPFDLPDRPTASQVYDLVAANLAEGFAQLYDDLKYQRSIGVAQDHSKASWRSKRTPKDGWIDFSKSAEQIDRLVRAVGKPYPGAYSYFEDEKVVFWRSEPASGSDLNRFGAYGQILAKSSEMLLVQAGDTPLWLSHPDFSQDTSLKFRIGDRFGFVIEDELHSLRARVARLEDLLRKGVPVLLEAKKVLVIVAHPDDETLGAGGTIRLLADRGVPVDLLIVTDGSSAQFGNDMDARAQRISHLKAACDVLGIRKFEIFEFPDMRLDTVAHIDLNNAIGTFVGEGGYDTILTHHPGDINIDHRYVFESVMVVARPQPGAKIKTVATFHVNSSTEWGAFFEHRTFLPNCFVDISSTVAAKLEALSKFEVELRVWPHPRSLEAVTARARTIGSEVGVEAAEPFHIIRTVIAAGDGVYG